MRASMTVPTFALVMSAVLLTSGTNAASNRMPELERTAWSLSALPGSSSVSDRQVTMRFESGRVHGTDGCNRYSAPYSTSPDGFQLTAPVVSTKMACPEPVMKQAEAFLAALAKARGARIDDGHLFLVDAVGVIVATLDAQSQEIAGTEWTVTGYNTGTNAVVGVLAETHLSVRFSADGKISGSAGCNDYTGSYSFSGQSLTIGETAATRKMCAQPEGVMKQERLFLNALAMVTLARVDGDLLELRARDGGLAVKAVRSDGPRSQRSASSPLAGELRYMADAARFTQCSSGRSYPVAMEADFASLERAYLDAVSEPAAPLYVTFEGSIADRPRMEGEGTEPTVVVDRFLAVSPGKRCE
ncbi:MAG TPA: META domain-containing protein [Candidatus Binatia bacterium]|nr:META domain-containing protein [Candidatus Binatia bacterium]